MPETRTGDHALALPADRSPEQILAHPRFAIARARFVDAVLALYEGDAFLTRLTVEAARQVIFNLIVCLDAGSDPDDPATWPTVRLLKQQMVQYQLSSPRRIESLVAQLVHHDFVKSNPSQRDGRVRLLTPTARMLARYQDWLVVNYLPLQVMFPDPGYGGIMSHDPALHRALCRTMAGFAGKGAQILGGNPDIMLFLGRDAGTLILFKLAQLAGAPNSGAVALDYKETAARFGVSRTHVQNVLQDAASAGLVAVSGRGGRFVALTAAIWRALDRFIAESMSGHDMLFNIAQRELTITRRIAS